MIRNIWFRFELGKTGHVNASEYAYPCMCMQIRAHMYAWMGVHGIYIYPCTRSFDTYEESGPKWTNLTFIEQLRDSFLTSLEKFDCDDDPRLVDLKWEKWKKGFQIFFITANIKDEETKRVTLLHTVGLQKFYIPGSKDPEQKMRKSMK